MSLVPQMQFSHVGITVIDFDKMLDFYTRVLGFAVSDLGEAARNGLKMAFITRDPAEHHQIVLAPGRPADAPSQINQLSFRMSSLSELRRMHDIVRQEDDVTDIAPTCHGNSWSVYFKDPEGNRIETFVQTPWYVHAPYSFALDLSMSDDEIFADTKEKVKSLPGYQPRTEWISQAAARMMEDGVWSCEWGR